MPKGIILIIMLALLSSSCMTQKKCSEKYPLQQTNERVRVIQQTLRDTIIRMNADSASLQALIECDSLGNAYLKQILKYEAGNKIMPPVVRIKENVLAVKTALPEQAIAASIKDTYITDTLIVYQTNTITTNRLTWWQQTQLYILRVLLIIIAIYYLLRRFKIIN